MSEWSSFAVSISFVAVFVVVVARWLRSVDLLAPECRFGFQPEGMESCRALPMDGCASGFCRYHCERRCRCAPVGRGGELKVVPGGKGKSA